MKKILSIILAAILVFSLTVPAFAESFDSGVAVLRQEFARDVGPGTQGYAIDYSYYSPVKESGDTTMYPLVICLAGAGEGEYEGAEVQENDFAMWACDEYQAEFAFSGGAFIMMARAPEENYLYWSSSSLTASLKACIDDFCEKHPNVDTNRIYALGWCLGAKGVMNLEKKYPGTLATAVLIAPKFDYIESVAESETTTWAKALKNTNVWLMASKYDYYSLYTRCSTFWEKLIKYNTNNKARIFTSYTKCPTAGLLTNHNMWLDASYDWGDYIPQNTFSKSTVDESGKKITIDSFIAFLSSANTSGYKVKDNGTSDEGCTCLCHSKSFFNRFRWNILLKIYVFFGMSDKLTCDCGASHVDPVVCENPEEITSATEEDLSIPDDDDDVSDTTDETDATSATKKDDTSDTTEPTSESDTSVTAETSDTTKASAPGDLDYEDTTSATDASDTTDVTNPTDETSAADEITTSDPLDLDYGEITTA